MGRLVKIGDKYNRLEVVEYKSTDDHFRKFWVCKCDCGSQLITHSGSLRSGNTKSCGCLAKDVMAATRKPDNWGEITAIMSGYRRGAKDRGFVWKLTRKQVEIIVREPCYYCGSEPNNRKVTKNSLSPFFYSGIDRVDNSIGYIASNVVPCCTICNRAKKDMSVGEFMQWINKVSSCFRSGKYIRMANSNQNNSLAV